LQEVIAEYLGPSDLFKEMCALALHSNKADLKKRTKAYKNNAIFLIITNLKNEVKIEARKDN
jgi:hypothetical protein